MKITEYRKGKCTECGTDCYYTGKYVTIEDHQAIAIICCQINTASMALKSFGSGELNLPIEKTYESVRACLDSLVEGYIMRDKKLEEYIDKFELEVPKGYSAFLYDDEIIFHQNNHTHSLFDLDYMMSRD